MDKPFNEAATGKEDIDRINADIRNRPEPIHQAIPPDLWARLRSLCEPGNLREALGCAEDAARRYGDNAELLTARGEIFLNLGETGNALGRFDKAVLLSPGSLSAHIGRGMALYLLDRLPEAELALDTAVGIAPDNEEVMKLAGALHLKSRNAKDCPETLPGTPYTHVLMPLDYPPSRDYRARWGNSRPPHAGLKKLFSRWDADYRDILSEMRGLTPFLSAIKTQFTHEAAPEPGWVGPPVNALDLALLYYFVWKHRPRTYLEIGSGSTTCFARRAISDHGLSTRIVSIDPSPRAAIDSICDEVVRDGLETLTDLSIFSALEPGDILFMDGSHRAFMNSDVTVFMLDILPLLKPGVIVHVHDIALPCDYADSFKAWYWNEQYLLAVHLLAAGDRLRVLMPSAYLGMAEGVRDSLRPVLLPGVGDEGTWTCGGSLWFTHVDPARRDSGTGGGR